MTAHELIIDEVFSHFVNNIDRLKAEDFYADTKS